MILALRTHRPTPWLASAALHGLVIGLLWLISQAGSPAGQSPTPWTATDEDRSHVMTVRWLTDPADAPPAPPDTSPSPTEPRAPGTKTTHATQTPARPMATDSPDATSKALPMDAPATPSPRNQSPVADNSPHRTASPRDADTPSPALHKPAPSGTVSHPEVAMAPALPAQGTAATPPNPSAPTATTHPTAAQAPSPSAGLQQAATFPADHRACSERSIDTYYPAMLRDRGIEGVVVLRVQVDEHGRAAEVRVQRGSGWRLLDDAATQVARACPFVPARRGDQTLVSWVEYPVRFALHTLSQ